MKKFSNTVQLFKLAALVIGVSGLFHSAVCQVEGYTRYGPVPNAMPSTTANDSLFGRAMTSIGDVNGDGTEDLAVSAVRNINGQTRDVVHIIFMAHNGAMDSLYTIDVNDPVAGSIFQLGDLTGTSLAAIGDINDDGIPDLAIGSPGSDIGGNNTGAFHLLLLTTKGRVGSYRSYNRNSTGFSDAPSIGSAFGSSICSAGDLDLDGRSEIFVGAPTNDIGGTGRGAGHILFLDGSLNISRSQRLAFGESGMGNYPEFDDAHFGTAVCTAQDINQDGVPDLLVSAPGGPNGGEVYLIMINEEGFAIDIEPIRTTEGKELSGIIEGDAFGSSLAFLNKRDGSVEIAIGSALANTGKGMIWLAEIDASAVDVLEYTILDSIIPNSTTLSYQPTDGFGTAMATGADLDGNGSRDLWVTAPNTVLAGSSSGNVWSIRTRSLPQIPHILASVTPLTARNTASGQIIVEPIDFGPIDPQYEWSGSGSGSIYPNLELGNVGLTVHNSPEPSIAKFYSMGYEVHWKDFIKNDLHEGDLVHAQPNIHSVTAQATNYFEAEIDLWLEYEREITATSGYVGFLPETQLAGNYSDIKWGVYITELGNVFRIEDGVADFLGATMPGDVIKVERVSGTFRWLIDGVEVGTSSTVYQGHLQLHAGVLGYGNALKKVRVSHTPGLQIKLKVEHATKEALKSGSIIAIPRWGVEPYSYVWSDNSKADRLVGLEAGLYSLLLTDQKNNSVSAEVNIATKVTIFPTSGVRYENEELFKIGEDVWDDQEGLSENFIASGDSGWVQLTVLEADVELAFALRDVSSNVQFGMKTTGSLLYSFLEGGKEEATLILGEENKSIPLEANDIIGIQRQITPSGVVVNFLHNGEVVLAYSETTANRQLQLKLELGSATTKAKDLVGLFTLRDDVEESATAWNYRVTRSYHDDGSIRAHSKTFLDHLGRPVQTQTKDMSTNNVLVSQTVYDHLGRPALQTLPAPSYSTTVNDFRSGFITASNGDNYGPENFDRPIAGNTAGEVLNPMPVRSNSQGSLGWYYSNNNNFEPYVATSGYPFTRIRYHHDAMSKPMATYAPGEAFIPGALIAGGRGTKQFTFNGADILPRFSHTDAWGSLNASKTVTVDPEGRETISYMNERGQILATCRSGMASDCRLQEVHARMETDGERRVDIHLPASQKNAYGQGLGFSSMRLPIITSNSFDQSGQVEHQIMDIESGHVLQLGIDYSYYTLIGDTPLDRYVKFFGTYATGNSYFRISYHFNLEEPIDNNPTSPFTLDELPDEEVWYTLDYGDWSLNQYSDKGELIAVVPPEGVDCDVEFNYVFQSFNFDDGNVINFCTLVGEDRQPRTTDDFIGTVIFDVVDDLELSAPLNQANTSRSFVFQPALLGRDPLRVTGTLGSYAEAYDAYNYYHAIGEDPVPPPPCDYTYHSPLPTVPRLNEGTKVSSYRVRQQDPNIVVDRSAVLTPFQPISGPAKSLAPIATNPRDPGSPEPESGPCVGLPDQHYATYRVKLQFYKVINGNETLIGSGTENELYAQLMRTCECEMYWAIGSALPITIPQSMLGDAGNVIIKLAGIDVDLTRAEDGFSPYNQNIYKHDLVRFLDMTMTVNMYTTPIATTTHHRMQQVYKYDALSQLLQSADPDRGTTEMLYDDRGQLRFSQNAEQANPDAEGSMRFSFVDYDKVGRTLRTGVYAYLPNNNLYMQWRGPFEPEWNPNEQFNTRTPGLLNDGPWLEGTHCEEISTISYDTPASDLPTTLYPSLKQRVPPGAISRTANAESTTWYSYDVRGRLSWTLHHTVGLDKYHTVHYDYDNHGQVGHVAYQIEVPAERFDHWYTYDAIGRLRKVLTGTDGIAETATERAGYQYYTHGPLKRTALGTKLQGVDYVYTLQGWLKAMNSPDAQERDPGRDGVAGGANASFKPDLFGMALDYFSGDYQRAGVYMATDLGTTADVAPNRYNGLVRAQRWNNRALTDPASYRFGGQNLFYGYKYDALGQLERAQLGTVLAPTTIGATPSLTLQADYKLWDLTYDKNGNLNTLNRNGQLPQGLPMDQLAYHYAVDPNGHKINNRLDHVTDAVTTPSTNPYTTFELPSGQAGNNYAYNALGQLTDDSHENRHFTYYANGRVKAVYANATPSQKLAGYTYDASGNRLLKESYAPNGTTPTEQTWYLRDAGGAVLSYTRKDMALATTTEELPIAGVGSYMRTSNTVRYELTDQLGNTRVSFTANQAGILSVIEAHDYYPHGGLLPGRQLSSTAGSPLAYQGQEYDPEVGLTAFNLRQYDARLGRWLTTDPYGQHYSPYLAMSNNPVSFVDPDGGYDDIAGEDEVTRSQRLSEEARKRASDRWLKFAAGPGSKNGLSGASSDNEYLRMFVERDDAFAEWMRATGPTVRTITTRTQTNLDEGIFFKPLEQRIVSGGYGSDGGPGDPPTRARSLPSEGQRDQLGGLIHEPTAEDWSADPAVAFRDWVNSGVYRLLGFEHIDNLSYGAASGDLSGGEVVNGVIQMIGFPGRVGAPRAMRRPARIRNGLPPPNLTQAGFGRSGALRQLLRDNGIPTTITPRVGPNMDRLGNVVPGKTYIYDVPGPDGTTIPFIVREDLGSYFGPGNKQNRGPHFNDPCGGHYDY